MQLHRELHTIRSRGAELVVVGQGNSRWARAFRERLALSSPVYVDPEREIYAALGMKRGVASQLTLGALRNYWRALRSGHFPRGLLGDTLQQGGVLVVLPGGRIAYRYLSREAGDHPPVADVLAALPALGARATTGP